MCYHLLLILMCKFLWGLLSSNPLLWQRAFTSYEIAELLSVCTPHFASQPVRQAQKSIESDGHADLELTPLKAAQRDKALPQSTDGLFRVVRYKEPTAQSQCSNKKCSKKMKQYSICVSFQCLQQRRQAEKARVCQLYCCLDLKCLNGARNMFTDALPKFNNRFDHIPEQLSTEERASINACIQTVSPSPSKRSITTPNQSPAKRGRPSPT
jgi:hypothetical protein